jgi:hypothetical protein
VQSTRNGCENIGQAWAGNNAQKAAGTLELVYDLSEQSVAIEIRLTTEQQQKKWKRKSDRKLKITDNENPFWRKS